MNPNDINKLLKEMEKGKKPKMLVVDDEPDNLDLLYRTFRRSFQVYKANSGVEALEVLSNQGEVAVIISDQRMPEMKGTEFLSKTVPQFPDTMRIILTGFSDVEDLVDAINSGQVYKYITKPWDPQTLRLVVQDAAETYDTLRGRRLERHRTNKQVALLMKIGEIAQTATSIEATLEPIATAIGESLQGDGCILQLVENQSLVATQGKYSNGELAADFLVQDPLVTKVINARQLQVWIESLVDSNATTSQHYQGTDLKVHIAAPVFFRKQLEAILSVQWRKDYQVREENIELIDSLAQQIGLALGCVDH
ncbi:MAG: response regulator [Spirulinaceae cyanobacterium]